ncbi:MAG: hypothetical protein Q7S50_02800 [bacterium]|nr:hypothetical protein [bacterium]
MMYFFVGTDREKTRAAMDAAIKKLPKENVRVVRISDAHTSEDLRATLQGAGMFGEARVVVLDGVFANEEMMPLAESALPAMKKSSETFFILEEKPLADVRKKIEKYAEKTERYDAAGKKRDGSIFGLSNALARKDKKALWVGYQRELAKGTAPEAIHGVLFWAVKDLFMKSLPAGRQEATGAHNRAKKLIAELAELPHEARRRGEELEYALERFVLSGV